MGWPLWLSIVGNISDWGAFGLFNGILIAKFGLPLFIATLWYNDDFTWFKLNRIKRTKCNVPLRGTGEGWYKDLFRTQDNFPTGLIVLIVVAIIAAIVLKQNKNWSLASLPSVQIKKLLDFQV